MYLACDFISGLHFHAKFALTSIYLSIEDLLYILWCLFIGEEEIPEHTG